MARKSESATYTAAGLAAAIRKGGNFQAAIEAWAETGDPKEE